MSLPPPGGGDLGVRVDSISPRTAKPGDTLNIQGAGFTDHVADTGQHVSSIVTILWGNEKIPCQILQATDTSINVVCPAGASSGVLEIDQGVYGGGLPSATLATLTPSVTVTTTSGGGGGPAKPSITGFSKKSVAQDTAFQVLGSHFDNTRVTAVQIFWIEGGVQKSVTPVWSVVDDGHIKVTVPRTLPTGSAYGVKATNSKGSAELGGLTVTPFNPSIKVKKTKKPGILGGIATAFGSVVAFTETTLVPSSVEIETGLAIATPAGGLAAFILLGGVGGDSYQPTPPAPGDSIQIPNVGAGAAEAAAGDQSFALTLTMRQSILARWGDVVRKAVIELTGAKISQRERKSNDGAVLVRIIPACLLDGPGIADARILTVATVSAIGSKCVITDGFIEVELLRGGGSTGGPNNVNLLPGIKNQGAIELYPVLLSGGGIVQFSTRVRALVHYVNDGVPVTMDVTLTEPGFPLAGSYVRDLLRPIQVIAANGGNPWGGG